MSIAGTTIAFLSAIAAGRNKPVADIDATRAAARIERLEIEKAGLEIEIHAKDALIREQADIITGYTAQFEHIIAQRDSALRQRDQIGDHLAQMNAFQPMPQQVYVGPQQAQHALGEQSQNPNGLGALGPLSLMGAQMLDFCNCVPARHDMLRPPRVAPNSNGRI